MARIPEWQTGTGPKITFYCQRKMVVAPYCLQRKTATTGEFAIAKLIRTGSAESSGGTGSEITSLVNL